MTSEKTGLWKRSRAVAMAALAGLGVVVAAGAIQAAGPATPAYLATFPNFNPAVTPQMPGDVDTGLKKTLIDKGQFALVQREFDLYSWQMFLALNWPTNNLGQPAPTLESQGFGPPHWTLWHTSNSIFQVDGAKPTACAGPPAARAMALTRDLSKPVSQGLMPFSAAAAAANPRATRFLGVISAVGELNASNLGDIQQAFTGPLIDQNGNFVYYEIMIDPNEVGYLCDNKLYNINGQVAFAGAGGKVAMPSGAPDKAWSGAFELKLAWKILTSKDDPSRFYHMDAFVIDQGPDGRQVERRVTVGLVGFHIGHKSGTSPQWIWSTFEQVDNLDVDPVAHPNLHASFFDPNCWICTVDQQPQKVNGAYAKVPTQAWRAIPIPGDKISLNAQVQAALGRAHSVWQYYQLIDTQWPTIPNTPASPYNAGLPASVANKPGGAPTPVFLTNITMETYFQYGNQEACNSEEAVPNSENCQGPPSVPSPTAQPPIWTTPQNNGTAPGLPGIHTTVFATESCMGCHSSAGVWTSYNPATKKGTRSGQLTGDFSWLMTQKAHYFGP